jgi:hypothetical protein
LSCSKSTRGRHAVTIVWKLKDLGGIVTKENVVREGPGRYGSEVYHGTLHNQGPA